MTKELLEATLKTCFCTCQVCEKNRSCVVYPSEGDVAWMCAGCLAALQLFLDEEAGDRS